jgi:TRAP-type C4-dicarboxylate transport system permease small subunit
MAELSDGKAPPRVGPLFYIGAGGLLLAMTVECIAVLGRQIGVPLHGAIEIIQAAILLTATVSMVSATLADAHAVVRLVIARLSPVPKRRLQRCGALLAALFFTALAIGAIWLAIEHWNTHEESELLHIPFRPLRALVCLALISIAGIFAYRAFASRTEER